MLPGAGFTALSQASDEQHRTAGRRRARERWREVRADARALAAGACGARGCSCWCFAPLFAGVILLWEYRARAVRLRVHVHGQTCHRHCTVQRPGTTALQVFVVLALVILGWALARDFGRGLAPLLFRRDGRRRRPAPPAS